MSNQAFIGLDNPAFQGRLRQHDRTLSVSSSRQPQRHVDRYARRERGSINDFTVSRPATTYKQVTVVKPAVNIIKQPTQLLNEVRIVEPQPFAEPALPRLQPSNVLKRRSVHFPKKQRNPTSTKNHVSKLQTSLLVMAAIVFVVGIGASIQTIKTNHAAARQVSALAKKSNSNVYVGNAPVPSTTKPSDQAVSQYVVAPDLARYLNIPKLGIHSRVLQVGINSTGALDAPNNIFDSAWYAGSAKPGQPGATLIDGHVSSWTSHGVFYKLSKLVTGDRIQIIKGDGTTVNYQVVKTQTYSASNVDMRAAINPVTAGRSGLNLITCTGDVIKGTSQFSERVIVFAQQV